jgi:ribose-phosphate pyrophosphokinase
MSALTLLAGTANPALAEEVAAQLGVTLADRVASHFPDGELHVQLGASVRGHDVYLVQPTSPAAETHLFQLLLLADACRRAGAARLTAVMPYVAYARQDRRGAGREPVGARVVAEVLATGGLDRVVAVDLHSPALEGVFSVPVEHLTAVPLLAAALPTLTGPAVVVAPDLGATKLAERYARLLDLPVALVHKRRLTGEQVTVRGVTGDVRGRSPLVVDDMITTGGTIEAAVTALLEAGCARDIVVSATHGLFVGDAGRRLAALPIRETVVTDSVALSATDGLRVRRVSLAPLLAEAIRRLHEDRSLGDMVVHL